MNELQFWGKASPANAESTPFHPLIYHALDVAAVFEALLLTDPSVLSNMAAPFGCPSGAIVEPLSALVALHDIGKVDAKFQAKSRISWPQSLGPWPGEPAAYDHAAGSMKLFDGPLGKLVAKLLKDDDFYAREALLAPIAFHHGKPQDRHPAGGSSLSWGTAQNARAVAEAIISAFDNHTLPTLPAISEEVARQMSWRLSGLVSLADWIGSSTDFFHYERADFTPGDYWSKVARPRARAALQALRIAPSPPNLDASYRTLFDATWAPTAGQAYCSKFVLPPGPALVFVEDVTGSGKTEAALLLAQRMMIAGKAKGLFVALPTMATANAMYARMASCYRRLFATGATPSLALAHGRSRLHEGFRASVLPNHGRSEGGADGEIETVQAACSAFFADDRRKALLADVGVGTIDQALLGVLPTKYATLRQFGLAGKILIVDEAHAYDAYISRELERLLTFHAGMGGSSIILSATLPRRMKERYAAAFLGGCSYQMVAMQSDAYPLVSTISPGAQPVEAPIEARADLKRRVYVARLPTVEEALDRIVVAAAQGASVAYIRNTVDDAIDAFEDLRKKGLAPILFHARFAMIDRLKVEEEALAIFGKTGTAEQRRGRVLVATQIIEQSLDLDFDLIITDLAPIDLIVQRAGRLWRHERGPRPIAGPQLFVVSPEPIEAAAEDWFPKFFQRAAYVYKAHGLLWLSAKVLFDAAAIVSPEGVREMIETVYGADAREKIPEGLRPNFDAMEGAAFGEMSHADNNLLDFFAGYAADHRAWSSDVRTPTRLGDEQTIFRLAFWKDGSLRPYAEDPDVFRAWALSEVSVRATRASGRGQYDDEVEAAARALEELWRRNGDSAVILPLIGGAPWRANAGKAFKGGVQPIVLLYDETCGLMSTSTE
ncbi:CRISPR-associated helicase Cas3' [Methylocystis sp. WRRC1]|uniref:CRISPR-associated helicase Cas3' n=1 Tax=Methylocystis sp. WRRC1 TaxID=1732014 RepID=UPI001D133DDB|nr:CRISPR-associated helicase Cas3' [Methylocystis sp. WRRC1]MCC3246302.1 CRISPR-associated helicase Cas3' [Methylocystis sp. WRRC1]